jgi:hypothetical protein
MTEPIELTSFSVSRVWRSMLILSFASCYIMWGMSSHSSVVLAIPSVAFPERRYTGYGPNYTRPYPLSFFPYHFGFHAVSRTDSPQSSDYIPCTMASSNSTENDHLQSLSGLVGCRLG